MLLLFIQSNSFIHSKIARAYPCPVNKKCVLYIRNIYNIFFIYFISSHVFISCRYIYTYTYIYKHIHAYCVAKKGYYSPPPPPTLFYPRLPLLIPSPGSRPGCLSSFDLSVCTQHVKEVFLARCSHNFQFIGIRKYIE